MWTGGFLKCDARYALSWNGGISYWSRRSTSCGSTLGDTKHCAILQSSRRGSITTWDRTNTSSMSRSITQGLVREFWTRWLLGLYKCIRKKWFNFLLCFIYSSLATPCMITMLARSCIMLSMSRISLTSIGLTW